MGYCIQNGADDGDIAPSTISIEQLIQLTTEEADAGEDDVDQTIIEEAIAGGDSLIDSYCRKRYTIPFSPVPNRVKDLSRKFAAFNLFDRRASIGIPENVRKWFEDGIAFLKDVAKGTASIDGAIEPTSNPKTTGGSFNANDRIFGKDSLDSL